MTGRDQRDDGSAPTTRTAELGGRDRLVVQRFTLEVVEGPDQGARFESSGDRAVIGVGASCNMVLTDETVSRFHCEITLARGRPFRSTSAAATARWSTVCR